MIKFDDVIEFIASADAETLRKLVGAAYRQHEKLVGPPRYSCMGCGCTDIETESWVPINGGEMQVPDLGTVALLSSSSEGSVYCQQCNDHNKWYCEIDPETGECKSHGGHDCPKPHPYEEAKE